MSVPSQQSVFAIAPQASRYGDSTFTTSALTWRRMRIPRSAGLSQQMQTMLPPENGNVIVATGAYKFGAFVGSEIDIIPRLENNFGWLLEATMGAVSSVTDANYTASGFIAGMTGVNAHLFRFNPSNSFDIPWLAIRRTIPGASATYGEIGVDCKVNMMRLNFPGAGIMTSRIGFVGRRFFQESPAAWAYEAAFEGETFAQSGRGSLTMGSDSPTITGLSVDIVNGLTSPQQEMIIGSFNPDTFVPLSRGCTLRMVLKWSNAELYRRILNGGASNLTWDSIPFIGETVGNTRAFAAEFASAEAIPGASNSQGYKLKLFANKVAWQFDAAGIELQAGEVLSLPFVGQVMDAGDGTDYFQIALENDAASYAWPT